MSATGNFWDRIGVYVVIAGLFAGCAALMVLLTQHLIESNPTLLALKSQAEDGNVQAQLSLGRAYQDGTMGLKRDDAEGLKWIRRAAESGKPGSAGAQGYLCYMYLFGYHTARDVTHGVPVCQASADAGDAYGERLRAYMAYSGAGVTQDYASAADWYEKAAAAGDDYSDFMLGIIYRDGLGRTKDVATAHRWLQKSLTANYRPARCALAMLHFDHGDTAVDDRQAMQWLEAGGREDEVECMNGEAWGLAITPNAALRDPARAETWAVKALALAPDRPAFLDTLAAAYAAQGRFDEAVVQQEKALAKLPDTKGYAAERDGMQKRLTLYRQHQPYVLTTPATAMTTQKSSSTGGGS